MRSVVEQRDNRQGSDIVDYRQGQQEDAQAGRVFRPNDRQCPDEKSGVGGDHHAPGPRVFPGLVEQQEDHGGQDQTRDRGDHRHRGPGPVGELADGELAGDLEADDEEEERHEARR